MSEETCRVKHLEESDPVNHRWEPTGGMRYIRRDYERVLQYEYGLKIKKDDGTFSFPNKLIFYKDSAGNWISEIDSEWVDFFVWRDVPTVMPWPTSLKVGG